MVYQKIIFLIIDSIIKFIHGHEPAKVVKLTKSSISNLRNRETIPRAVPRTKENEAFIEYVQRHMKFDGDLFFRQLSSDAIKVLIKGNDKAKYQNNEKKYKGAN